jgi:hypothetical protein
MRKQESAGLRCHEDEEGVPQGWHEVEVEDEDDLVLDTFRSL